MAPLKEAVLLPVMIQNARSPTTCKLLKGRRDDVIAELALTDKAVLLEDARDLLLSGDAKINELAPVFVEIGVIDQNSYIGALKLVLMLGDDRFLKIAAEHAKEKGASIFEIRDVVWKEGLEQKMDVVYSVFADGSLPSYDFLYKPRERHLGNGDVEGIRDAVAFLHTREKTTKILRNEYRKKEYVKAYSKKLKAEAEKELEKIPRDKEGKVHEDNFALAVYRAYFEDVYLLKQKEKAHYYLRLIEKYRICNPFTTAIVKHALEHGEKRAREKALRMVRDFKLNIDVESVLKSENLNERVIALQVLLSKGWNEIFREMLFSEFYKERKIALEAFLKYMPKINEEEEKRIRRLARTEIGKCEVLAKELLKKSAEMKTEKQKPKFEIKPYVDKVKETAKLACVHAMENLERSLEKSRVLAEKIRESSAKVFETAALYGRDAYKMSVEVSKNIFAYLSEANFRLRLEWMEKRARMVTRAKRMRKEIQDVVFSLAAFLPTFANEMKTRIDAAALSIDPRTALWYFLLSATVGITTTFSPQRTARAVEPKAAIVHALEKQKQEREKITSELVQKIIRGEMTLSDALRMLKTLKEKQELTKQLKKTEPPKSEPKPRIEMDEEIRKMYEEAVGVIGVTKGLESFEFNRAMLVDQYYSQKVGANKWINILIFGDNTAWTFPTANLGNSLSEIGSVNVGDILLNHIGSAYVLSDDCDGCYLIAYHDSKNGLRIVKFTFEEIKSEFDRVLSTEEANEFAKQKICEQLNLDPNNYNLVVRPLVFPTDYNCDRRWDDSSNCWVGNAHDFGAPREGGIRRHEGTDLYAPFGAPIYSPVDGVVVATGWGGSKAGKRVWIQGVDGYYYMMAHLDSITVKVGQFISAGMVVGKNGDTGNAEGLAAVGAAHDHQEIHKEGRNDPINPDQRLYDLWFVGLEERGFSKLFKQF